MYGVHGKGDAPDATHALPESCQDFPEDKRPKRCTSTFNNIFSYYLFEFCTVESSYKRPRSSKKILLTINIGL